LRAIMRVAQALLRSFSRTLFAGGCYLCRGAVTSGAASGLLCRECESELPRLPQEYCPRCALPSPGGADCGRCLARQPRFDRTTAALAYSFPANVLVQGLKFNAQLAVAPLLAGLLEERIDASREVDIVIPVPLSRARLRARGYNQALEIARAMSVRAKRLDTRLIVRQRDTLAQAVLPWARRAQNVLGAFACTRPLAGARVAVVDDVMTTGATLDEIARELKDAGAATVVNWVAVRTLPRA